MFRLFTSLIFSVCMIILTIIFSLLGNIFFFLPHKYHYAMMRRYAYINIAILKTLCGVKYEVQGLENIPQQTAIIFSKHQSTWETMALQLFFPAHSYVVKRELLWIPFFGWGLASLSPIAIDRSSGRKAIRQIVDKGIKKLKMGRWIVIFPEGTRVPPGVHKRYKIGGAVLAAESGYPIVPVAHNAGEYWPKGQFLKKAGTIKIVIGPLIETKGRKPEEILTDAERWIETTMAQISLVDYPAYQPKND